MIHNDIINPLLNDFLTNVTGYGGPFFKSSAITRLNDFVDYLSELTYPNFDFAFYPLRRDQNIGYGKTGFGIGYLASGTPVVFSNNPVWGTNGISFGPKKNAGEIDFSGNVVGDFQFRRDQCSVFYFLQHSRRSFPTTFYRPNTEKIPYFCFDSSYDHFSVVSPNFSKSRFKGQGTTYIYDEIYGEDQKGLQIDWSQKPSEKYYLPQSLSFYQMDKDIPSGQYICIYGNFDFDNYLIKTIYGKDYRYLSGNFLNPYTVEILGEDQDDRQANKYFFPQRMVIGAGVSNKGFEYDTDGMDHLCPGVLILKGNYLHKSDEIAEKMSQCIGITNETFIEYSNLLDSSNIQGSITGLKYAESIPKILSPIKHISSFSAKIKSIFLKFIGIVTFTKYPWGWWGTTSLEQSEIVNEITGMPHNTGVLEYRYPILGSEYNQITGFVSGFLNSNGTKTIFTSDNISGASGFYYSDGESVKEIKFPPYKIYEQQKITGFISGNYDDVFGKFTPLNQELFVSGYYLDGQVFYLNSNTGINTKNIIGFISGVISSDGVFSGFDDSNINQTSGYIDDDKFISFPPYKYISGNESVIGYIRGVFSGNEFFQFQEVTYLYDNSGNITGSIPASDSNISGYFYRDNKIPFPTGSGFDGFNNMPYFYNDLGYEFSGFFVGSSGQLIENDEEYMTGFIGSKAAIYNSGSFNQFNNINGFDDAINYNFTGFFANNITGFSGIDPNWQLFDSDIQTGVLTGYIGSYTYIGSLGAGNINFDNKPGFNLFSGYAYSGFFVENSGFSGINNNPNGFGVLTGFIGYRVFSEKLLQFNGFTGISNIDSSYYSNVFVDFLNATGFSGLNNQSNGIGRFTGIISSGSLTGEVVKFVSSTGISTYTGYNFNVTGAYYNSGIQYIGAEIPNSFLSGEHPPVIGFLSGCMTQDTVSRLGNGCGYFKTDYFSEGYPGYFGSIYPVQERSYLSIERSAIYTEDNIYGGNASVGNFGTDDFTLEMWIKPVSLNYPWSLESPDIKEEDYYYFYGTHSIQVAGGWGGVHYPRTISYNDGEYIALIFPTPKRQNWSLVLEPSNVKNFSTHHFLYKSGYNQNPVIKFFFNTGDIIQSIDEDLDCDDERQCMEMVESNPGQELKIGQWNHIAVVKNNDSIGLYLNGIKGPSKILPSGAVIGTYNDIERLSDVYGGNDESETFRFLNNLVQVGSSTNRRYVGPFEGYIEDFRITTGIARYTFDFFTGSIGRFGNNISTDPLYENVDLLINMTGIYQSKFKDDSKYKRKINTIAFAYYNIAFDTNIGGVFPNAPIIDGSRFDYTRSGFLISGTYYNYPTNNDFSTIPYLTESKNIDVYDQIYLPNNPQFLTYELPANFEFSGFNTDNMEFNNNSGCRILSGYVGQKFYDITNFLFGSGLNKILDRGFLDSSIDDFSYYPGTIQLNIISGIIIPQFSDITSGELPLISGFLSGCFSPQMPFNIGDQVPSGISIDNISRLSGGCAYFPDTGKYCGINITGNAIIADFGTGNFTIEFWIKPKELQYYYQTNNWPDDHNWNWPDNEVRVLSFDPEKGFEPATMGRTISGQIIEFNEDGTWANYYNTYAPIDRYTKPNRWSVGLYPSDNAVRFRFNSGETYWSGQCNELLFPETFFDRNYEDLSTLSRREFEIDLNISKSNSLNTDAVILDLNNAIKISTSSQGNINIKITGFNTFGNYIQNSTGLFIDDLEIWNAAINKYVPYQINTEPLISNLKIRRKRNAINSLDNRDDSIFIETQYISGSTFGWFPLRFAKNQSFEYRVPKNFLISGNSTNSYVPSSNIFIGCENGGQKQFKGRLAVNINENFEFYQITPSMERTRDVDYSSFVVSSGWSGWYLNVFNNIEINNETYTNVLNGIENPPSNIRYRFVSGQTMVRKHIRGVVPPTKIGWINILNVSGSNNKIKDYGIDNYDLVSSGNVSASGNFILLNGGFIKIESTGSEEYIPPIYGPDRCRSLISSLSGQQLNSGWNHIAVVRNENTITLYLNGISGESKGISNTSFLGTGLYKTFNWNNIYYLHIGDIPVDSTWEYTASSYWRKLYKNGFNGYIEDLRITKNIPRYISGFSGNLPSYFGNNNVDDPFYDNVELLMHMNGNQFSTDFVDSSKNSISSSNILLPSNDFTTDYVQATNKPDLEIKRYSTNPYIVGVDKKSLNGYIYTISGSGILVSGNFKSGYYLSGNQYSVDDISGFFIPEFSSDKIATIEYGTGYLEIGLDGYFKEDAPFFNKIYNNQNYINFSFEPNSCLNLTGFLGQKIYKYIFDTGISGISLSGISEQTSVEPNIINLTYRSAIVETGISGMSGILGQNPSGDYASVNVSIPSIELIEGEPFEIYPYIRAISGITYFTPQISQINYYEDMPGFGTGDFSRIVGAITGIRHFTFNNEFTFIDSGINYLASPINLSTGAPDIYSDMCEYRPVPILLTGIFPVSIQPPDVTDISDIEGLTEDPYFDSVVLLLNMSGENLSTNIIDSSKYHHKITATIGAGQTEENISYNLSGMSGIYLPWASESGVYTLSGMSGIYLPWASESGVYTLSGITGVTNAIAIHEETTTFGGSGVYINNDLEKSVESVGFGGSGVILITGIF